MKNKFLLISICFLWFLPGVASAHQPRIVSGNPINVSSPETSQAFYGELKGIPHEFIIRSDKEFRLYLGVLVPDIPMIRKDISVSVDRLSGATRERLALLNGENFNWTPFFETFAKDNYFWGPEFKDDNSQQGVALQGKLVPAGTYSITVFNSSEQGKYSLAVGDLETFPPIEIINAILVVPQLKANFFHYSLLVLLSSPYVIGYILLILAIAFVLGLLLRLLLVRFVKPKKSKGKNMNRKDRMIRLVAGIIILALAFIFGLNPYLLFLSGLCFFAAASGWCGLYAILGKSSCSI
ncbi:MAG: DUF2892 domain-containing protein [Candidatus Falkowbacteria bacterium]|nr:DUF2892 domain-containing protein [Candidatus Falkowbacteria bacterium]